MTHPTPKPGDVILTSGRETFLCCTLETLRDLYGCKVALRPDRTLYGYRPAPHQPNGIAWTSWGPDGSNALSCITRVIPCLALAEVAETPIPAKVVQSSILQAV